MINDVRNVAVNDARFSTIISNGIVKNLFIELRFGGTSLIRLDVHNVGTDLEYCFEKLTNYKTCCLLRHPITGNLLTFIGFVFPDYWKRLPQGKLLITFPSRYQDHIHNNIRAAKFHRCITIILAQYVQVSCDWPHSDLITLEMLSNWQTSRKIDSATYYIAY